MTKKSLFHSLKGLSLLFIFLFFVEKPAAAQSGFDFWKNLRDVSYQEKMDKNLGKIKLPIFGEKITVWEQQTITIKGYIMPLELGSEYFVISAYPFESCYFCGAAGPETVMEIFPTEHIPFMKVVTMRGVLKLNRTDINRLMFKLENAVLVK